MRRSRTLRRGRKAEVARVRLAQPARVSITVRRGRTVVKRAPRKCAATSRSLRWSPRRTGRYTVEIRIASDRATDVRRSTLTVR